ncbi:MAG: hypothetical protein ABJZ55_06190 [Fuerstiella sp.]
MNCRRSIPLHLYSLLLITVLGCAGSSSLPDGVETGTVSGIIVCDGGTFPEGCVVNFRPDAGTLLTASGKLASDGSFELSLREMPDIPTGSYKVTVQPPPLPPLTDEEREKEMLEGTTIDRSNLIDQIPFKYMSTQTTPESVTVTTGANEVIINLEQ